MDALPFPRRIAVLGSSGSIGQSALEVIEASQGRLLPVLLSVNSQTQLLAEQLRKLKQLPQWIVVTDENADRTPIEPFAREVEIFFGHDELRELVRRPEVDVVLSAIVGSAGLVSTWAALEMGKIVALANKESLVMGGELLTNLAKMHGGLLIPVDSEHSAIMQALHGAHASQCERIILTASGGPFRKLSLEKLAGVTIEDALAHPTWKMGKKITIDSATLMNKALEIIEARWFFDVPADKIEVVIHPQSLVHSMVEFIDGSVMAQLSPPDMRLPIQLALNYPYRFAGPATRMNWKQIHTLEFYPPDFERFPALRLGLEAAASGGTAGAVINAANEVAVDAFLDGKLPFQDIVKLCRAVLERHEFIQHPTLDQLLSIDRWARKSASGL